MYDALMAAGYIPPPGNDDDAREALLIELQDLVIQCREPDDDGLLPKPI